MPLQNRVTPWGDIVATSERGLFMGNRGCLHDDQRHVVKAWARIPWVTCRLEFKGRAREVMAPGKYTELFFLDEATALAAGHRPCATCRREEYRSFKHLWTAANPELVSKTDGSITSIDRLLHAERVDAGGQKRTWSAALVGLPDGTMVALDAERSAYLVKGGCLYPWTSGGYGAPLTVDSDTRVIVLTPPSVTRMLAKGYVAELHPSVETNLAAPPPPSLKTEPTPVPAISSRAAPAERPRKADSTLALKPVAVSPTRNTLHRLDNTPRGKELYTYFAAILSVTGMDEGAVYPLNKFLGNFSGHVKAGRIAKAPGGYRLTESGRNYFADRYHPGNRQYVERAEVEVMARLIRSGKAPGWVPMG